MSNQVKSVKKVNQIKLKFPPVFYLHDLKSILVLRNCCTDMCLFRIPFTFHMALLPCLKNGCCSPAQRDGDLLFFRPSSGRDGLRDIELQRGLRPAPHLHLGAGGRSGRGWPRPPAHHQAQSHINTPASCVLSISWWNTIPGWL